MHSQSLPQLPSPPDLVLSSSMPPLLPLRTQSDGQLALSGGAVLHGNGVRLPNGTSCTMCYDDFEDHGQIGIGSYSRVHKVLHRTSQSLMAVKKIPLQEDARGLSQIMLELDVLHQSSSPFIVQFRGAFFCDSVVFFCMELVDGSSLDKVIPLGPFPSHALGRIAHDVLEGLLYMKTTLDVIHRDVRPSNILMDHKGTIKLCDFGVSAKLVNSVAMTYVGTQKYMAPERIKSTEPYGVQADVWSLGMSLMEMAMAKPPYPRWDGTTVFQRMMFILQGPPPTSHLTQEGVDADLCDLLAQCLQMEPNSRPSLGALQQHTFVQRFANTSIDEWASLMLHQVHSLDT